MEIIKDFYNEHIRATQRKDLKGTKYENFMEYREKLLAIFESRFSKQDMIEFEKYIYCLDELCFIIAEENYSSGFRDGARLLIDVQQGENKILRGKIERVIKVDIF